MATDDPPIFSLVMGTNPLLAQTQWSPWMFNPLLSLQAQQAAALMLGAAGRNQAMFDLRRVAQLREAGQIEHMNSPAIQIAGPAYTGQFEHRSSPAIINAGPVITTGASHAADTSVEDRPIFQIE